MEPVVHKDAAAADRLAELGLTRHDLEVALRGADREARTWTPLAPPMMAGLARWTVRAIGRNVQLAFDFSDLYPGEARWATDDGDEVATWLLLYHVTPGQVVAELSLAHGLDERGHVSEWVERIILPAIATEV